MPRYFVFTERNPDHEFVIELKDENKIQKALKILSGEETKDIHVMGRIRKEKKPYNPKWDIHLDPDTIDFFSSAPEVNDGLNMWYVNDHIDEIGGSYLPGNWWNPWDSRLVREITPEVTPKVTP